MKPALFHATEQPTLRGEYTKTYSVGPGTYKAFTSPVPLHVRSGNDWLPCDARFLPDPESGILTALSLPAGISACRQCFFISQWQKMYLLEH